MQTWPDWNKLYANWQCLYYGVAFSDEQWQALDSHAFKAPPCNDRPFSFFITGDTQFGNCTRGGLLETWRPLLEKAAFHGTLGDLSSIHDDYDMMLFGGYLNWLSPEDYHGKPFVAVRGNHELRGRERCSFCAVRSDWRYFPLLPNTQRPAYRPADSSCTAVLHSNPFRADWLHGTTSF